MIALILASPKIPGQILVQALSFLLWRSKLLYYSATLITLTAHASKLGKRPHWHFIALLLCVSEKLSGRRGFINVVENTSS